MSSMGCMTHVLLMSADAAQVRSLQHHAEKRARADLLLRGDSGSDLAMRINFKVCADCHAFLKAAAKLLCRCITVHEPKVRHTFDEHGVCSCGDRWKWKERQDQDSKREVTE